MEFYLVRHGEAVSQAVNGQRPLTPEGRRDVERLGRAAAQRVIQPSQIFHSGLLRAQQTADILGESLGPVEGVRELVGLRPDDDPVIAKTELETSTVSLMLVGHLPHLSRLASFLVAGDADRGVVEFAPATLLGLVYEDYRWKILWKITPATDVERVDRRNGIV
jgi:phosphohistidine phosphatase